MRGKPEEATMGLRDGLSLASSLGSTVSAVSTASLFTVSLHGTTPRYQPPISESEPV